MASATIGATDQRDRLMPVAATQPLTNTSAARTANVQIQSSSSCAMLFGTTCPVIFFVKKPLSPPTAPVIDVRFRQSAASSVPTYMSPPVTAPVVAIVPPVACQPARQISQTLSHTTAGIPAPTRPNRIASRIATLATRPSVAARRPVNDADNSRATYSSTARTASPRMAIPTPRVG